MDCLTAAFLLILIGDPGESCRNDWTRADQRRLWADRVITIVDWSQTRWIVEHGAEHGIVETGPLLSSNGRNPSKRRVDTHFPVMMSVKPLIAWVLPPKAREAFQYMTIGAGISTVGNNVYIGVKLDLD